MSTTSLFASGFQRTIPFRAEIFVCYLYCGKLPRVSRKTAKAPRPPREEGEGRPGIPFSFPWLLGGLGAWAVFLLIRGNLPQ